MEIRKQKIQVLKLLSTLLLCLFIFGCNQNDDTDPVIEEDQEVEDELEEESETYFLPDIDLSNWKVTLPFGNPYEVAPPEILNYSTNPLLKNYMFNDSTDGSLVFFTEPGSSTPNSSYSRTELREQLVPGSNNVNWTFSDGGRMIGKLAMDSISKDASGKYHRAIVMQIHGRLTDEQRELIGEDDNNAPPVLKIYWNNSKVRVLRKVLKDISVDDKTILTTGAWEDEGYWFDEPVGFSPFELEVIVSDSRMEVILNNDQSMVFDDIHMQKWNVFENYFKAGNYLVTTDNGAFSKVKYYKLSVEH